MSLWRDTSQIHKTCVWIVGICWWLNGGALTTHWNSDLSYPSGCPDLDHDTPRYTNFSRKCHQLPAASTSSTAEVREGGCPRGCGAPRPRWPGGGAALGGAEGREGAERSPPWKHPHRAEESLGEASVRIRGIRGIRWILVDFVGTLQNLWETIGPFQKSTIGNQMGINQWWVGNLKIFDKLRTHHWALPLKAWQTGVLSGDVRQGGRLVRCLCSSCQQWCCEARGLTWWSWFHQSHYRDPVTKNWGKVSRESCGEPRSWRYFVQLSYSSFTIRTGRTLVLAKAIDWHIALTQAGPDRAILKQHKATKILSELDWSDSTMRPQQASKWRATSNF